MAERTVNGWAKGGPTANRWHQVEWDPNKGTAVLACSGKVIKVEPRDVMDYRWQPPSPRGCLHAQCQVPVQP